MSVTVKKVSIVATLFILFGLLASCASGGTTAENKTVVFPEEKVATTQKVVTQELTENTVESELDSTVEEETSAPEEVKTVAETTSVDTAQDVTASQNNATNTVESKEEVKQEVVTVQQPIVEAPVVEEKKEIVVVEEAPAKVEEPVQATQEVVEEKVETPVVTSTPGVYADYSPEAVANAKGDIVLFFHATWCPACVAIENKIVGGQLPDNLTILKVDYDDSSELKKKYSVRTQTTFAQVDNTWELIYRWVGARDVADIQSRLK